MLSDILLVCGMRAFVYLGRNVIGESDGCLAAEVIPIEIYNRQRIIVSIPPCRWGDVMFTAEGFGDADPKRGPRGDTP